jgi:serine/threonine protein kinase
MELGELLAKNPQTLNKKRRFDILIQLIQALTYLHSLSPKIIHNDIKPTNIWVTETHQILLGSFEFAQEMTSKKLETFCGTPIFMSPGRYCLFAIIILEEQLMNVPFDEKSDIFSFGLIMWLLLPGTSYISN